MELSMYPISTPPLNPQHTRPKTTPPLPDNILQLKKAVTEKNISGMRLILLKMGEDLEKGTLDMRAFSGRGFQSLKIVLKAMNTVYWESTTPSQNECIAYATVLTHLCKALTPRESEKFRSDRVAQKHLTTIVAYNKEIIKRILPKDPITELAELVDLLSLEEKYSQPGVNGSGGNPENGKSPSASAVHNAEQLARHNIRGLRAEDKPATEYIRSLPVLPLTEESRKGLTALIGSDPATDRSKVLEQLDEVSRQLENGSTSFETAAQTVRLFTLLTADVLKHRDVRVAVEKLIHNCFKSDTPLQDPLKTTVLELSWCLVKKYGGERDRGILFRLGRISKIITPVIAALPALQDNGNEQENIPSSGIGKTITLILKTPDKTEKESLLYGLLMSLKPQGSVDLSPRLQRKNSTLKDDTDAAITARLKKLIALISVSPALMEIAGCPRLIKALEEVGKHYRHNASAFEAIESLRTTLYLTRRVYLAEDLSDGAAARTPQTTHIAKEMTSLFSDNFLRFFISLDRGLDLILTHRKKPRLNSEQQEMLRGLSETVSRIRQFAQTASTDLNDILKNGINAEALGKLEKWVESVDTTPLRNLVTRSVEIHTLFSDTSRFRSFLEDTMDPFLFKILKDNAFDTSTIAMQSPLKIALLVKDLSKQLPGQNLETLLKKSQAVGNQMNRVKKETETRQPLTSVEKVKHSTVVKKSELKALKSIPVSSPEFLARALPMAGKLAVKLASITAEDERFNAIRINLNNLYAAIADHLEVKNLRLSLDDYRQLHLTDIEKALPAGSLGRQQLTHLPRLMTIRAWLVLFDTFDRSKVDADGKITQLYKSLLDYQSEPASSRLHTLLKMTEFAAELAPRTQYGNTAALKAFLRQGLAICIRDADLSETRLKQSTLSTLRSLYFAIEKNLQWFIKIDPEITKVLQTARQTLVKVLNETFLPTLKLSEESKQVMDEARLNEFVQKDMDFRLRYINDQGVLTREAYQILTGTQVKGVDLRLVALRKQQASPSGVPAVITDLLNYVESHKHTTPSNKFIPDWIRQLSINELKDSPVYSRLEERKEYREDIIAGLWDQSPEKVEQTAIYYLHSQPAPLASVADIYTAGQLALELSRIPANEAAARQEKTRELTNQLKTLPPFAKMLLLRALAHVERLSEEYTRVTRQNMLEKQSKWLRGPYTVFNTLVGLTSVINSLDWLTTTEASIPEKEYALDRNESLKQLYYVLVEDASVRTALQDGLDGSLSFDAATREYRSPSVPGRTDSQEYYSTEEAGNLVPQLKSADALKTRAEQTAGDSPAEALSLLKQAIPLYKGLILELKKTLAAEKNEAFAKVKMQLIEDLEKRVEFCSNKQSRIFAMLLSQFKQAEEGTPENSVWQALQQVSEARKNAGAVYADLSDTQHYNSYMQYLTNIQTHYDACLTALNRVMLNIISRNDLDRFNWVNAFNDYITEAKKTAAGDLEKAKTQKATLVSKLKSNLQVDPLAKTIDTYRNFLEDMPVEEILGVLGVTDRTIKDMPDENRNALYGFLKPLVLATPLTLKNPSVRAVMTILGAFAKDPVIFDTLKELKLTFTDIVVTRETKEFVLKLFEDKYRQKDLVYRTYLAELTAATTKEDLISRLFKLILKLENRNIRNFRQIIFALSCHPLGQKLLSERWICSAILKDLNLSFPAANEFDKNQQRISPGLRIFWQISLDQHERPVYFSQFFPRPYAALAEKGAANLTLQDFIELPDDREMAQKEPHTGYVTPTAHTWKMGTNTVYGSGMQSVGECSVGSSKKPNEDAYAFKLNAAGTHLIAVDVDGNGTGSHILAKKIASGLSESLGNRTEITADSLSEDMKATAQKVEEWKATPEMEGFDGAGATTGVFALTEKKLVYGNLGDTRLVCIKISKATGQPSCSLISANHNWDSGEELDRLLKENKPVMLTTKDDIRYDGTPLTRGYGNDRDFVLTEPSVSEMQVDTATYDYIFIQSSDCIEHIPLEDIEQIAMYHYGNRPLKDVASAISQSLVRIATTVFPSFNEKTAIVNAKVDNTTIQTVVVTRE